MEPQRTNPEYILCSVRNALRILKSFSHDEPEKRLSDLAVSLGLSKSTISRLMATLSHEDFIQQDPKTKRYRLGCSVLPLGGIVTFQQEMLSLSLSHVHKLVDRMEETVDFLVLKDHEVFFVYSIDKNHLSRYYNNIGKRNPIHCTSAGKVILAHQPDEVLNTILAQGLHPFTVQTITQPSALKEGLEQIRIQGYSVSKEEYREGILDIAVPVRDQSGQVFGAISVSGTVQQLTRKKYPFYIREMMNTSEAISKSLFYQSTIEKEC